MSYYWLSLFPLKKKVYKIIMCTAQSLQIVRVSLIQHPHTHTYLVYALHVQCINTNSSDLFPKLHRLQVLLLKCKIKIFFIKNPESMETKISQKNLAGYGPKENDHWNYSSQKKKQKRRRKCLVQHPKNTGRKFWLHWGTCVPASLKSQATKLALSFILHWLTSTERSLWKYAV